jgi:hypothetical protein
MATCNSLAVHGQPVENSSHGAIPTIQSVPRTVSGMRLWSGAAQNQDLRCGAAPKKRTPLGTEKRGAYCQAQLTRVFFGWRCVELVRAPSKRKT